MGPALQHIANSSPITSLAFCTPPNADALLLAGEGSFVNILNTSNSQDSKTRRIFARERIHGIALSPTAPHVLFWGGRSISITSVSSLLALQHPPLREISAPDWVFYACFLPSVHGGIPRVAVITAHDALLVFSPYGGWIELAAGERCMLYSAHLLHLPTDSEGNQDRILVAAGTVFGEILLWSTPLTDTQGKADLHYRLLGHEGSIFGVNISPVYSTGARYLASCSDDRTVRIWDITNLPSPELSPKGKDSQSNNTGFSHTPATPSSDCIALGWAHTARIWAVRFLPNPAATGDITLVSTSEDLTSRFWRFTPCGNATLINTATYLLHGGKHVWSYALEPSRRLLATGGADGRVGLVKYNAERGEEEWDMETILDAALGEDASGVEDAIKAYAVLDSDRFLATTTQGRLLTYSLASKTWKLVTTVLSLKNWSVLAAWRGEGMVALGNVSGEVGVRSVDEGWEQWWCASNEIGAKGKVGGVWATAGPVKRGDITERVYHILTTSLPTCIFTLHSFTRSGSDIDRTTTTLLPPDEEGTKKFLVTSMCIDYVANLIFLGSRNGAIAVYALAGTPLGCWQGVHDADAITDIICRPCTEGAGVLTSGRNGGFCILAFVARESKGMEMVVMHAVRPGMWGVIEGVSMMDRGLVLYGFRGKSFFVWDEGQGCEVAAVECGGAHRAWGFYWPGARELEGRGGWLVWTKASKVRIARTPLTKQRVLLPGLHGREIKAIAASPDQRTLATGAEDTVIRLSQLDVHTRKVKCLAVFKRHTTGVQHLVWSTCGRWLFSSGGVEEFFVWRVRQLGGEGELGSLGIVEEAKCTVSEKGGDLRICGFDVMSLYSEGETEEVVGFIVAMVYSDSSIKIHHYNISAQTFTPIITGMYKSCCLLHAHLTLLPSRILLLLVASTDGFLTSWDLTSTLLHSNITTSTHLTLTPLTPAQKNKRKKRKAKIPEPHPLPIHTFTLRVHQSGIKTLAVTVQLDSLTVYTGGDDCALAVTRVRIPLLGVRTWVLPRAHASAVTGLVLMGARLVSVGVDQRVKVWDVEMDGEVGGEVRLACVEEAYTGVADVAGAVRVDRDVVVAGVGVDVWRVA